MKTASIKSVADSLKISRATVYRVINNHPYVCDDVREKVLEALKNAEYDINKHKCSAKKSTYRIAVLVNTRNDDYYNDICKGIYNAFEELNESGITIEIREVFSTMTSKWTNQLKELLSSRVDAVLTNTPQSEEINEAVEALTAAGIAVVTYGADLKNSSRLFYVGSDDKKNGRIVGQLLYKIMNIHGKLVICEGLEGNECHELRSAGVREYSEEQSRGIPCLTVQWDENLYENTLNLLRENTDVEAIVVVSRGVAAILRAIEDVQLQNHIKIIVFDNTREYRSFLRKDKIDAIIDQKPIQQGEKAIRMLYSYLSNGKSIEQDKVYTDAQIVIKEMLD